MNITVQCSFQDNQGHVSFLPFLVALAYVRFISLTSLHLILLWLSTLFRILIAKECGFKEIVIGDRVPFFSMQHEPKELMYGTVMEWNVFATIFFAILGLFVACRPPPHLLVHLIILWSSNIFQNLNRKGAQYQGNCNGRPSPILFYATLALIRNWRGERQLQRK